MELKCFKLGSANSYTYNLSIYSSRTVDRGRNVPEQMASDLTFSVY